MHDENEFNEVTEGLSIGRRDDSGRFQPGQVKLDPKRAAEMGKKAAERDPDALANALIDLLVDEDDPKSKSYSLLLRKIALKTTDRSLELLLQLIGERTRLTKPTKGQRCPLCATVYGSQVAPEIHVSDEVARWLFDKE